MLTNVHLTMVDVHRFVLILLAVLHVTVLMVTNLLMDPPVLVSLRDHQILCV